MDAFFVCLLFSILAFLGGRVGERKTALEELGFLTDDFRQKQVGQSASAQTEQFVGEPFFTQHFLDDGVVHQSIVYGIDAACRFEAHLAAGSLVVFPDGLTHHEGCFGSS